MKNNKAPLLRRIVQGIVLKAEKTVLEIEVIEEDLKNLQKDQDLLYDFIWRRSFPEIVWTSSFLVPEMPGFRPKYSIILNCAEILFDLIIRYIGYDKIADFVDFNQKISLFCEEERKEFSEKKKEFLYSHPEKVWKVERILDIIENGELLLIREQLNQEIENLTGEERSKFMKELLNISWKISKKLWKYWLKEKTDL